MRQLTDIFRQELMPALNSRLAAEFSGKEILFDAGSHEELTVRIDTLKNAYNAKPVYPLVWLVMPFTQITRDDENGYTVERTRIIIVEKSDGVMKSLDRIETVFKPVLVPIWETLKELITKSFSFGNPRLNYGYTQYTYAPGEGRKENLFNDTVDAIEIANLSLEVNEKPDKKYC